MDDNIDRLKDAAFLLLQQCWDADADGDLSEGIDAEAMVDVADALRALGVPVECDCEDEVPHRADCPIMKNRERVEAQRAARLGQAPL